MSRRAGWVAAGYAFSVSALSLAACTEETITPDRGRADPPIIGTAGKPASGVTAGVKAPAITGMAGATSSLPPTTPTNNSPPANPTANAAGTVAPPAQGVGGPSRGAAGTGAVAGTMAMKPPASAGMMAPPGVVVTPDQKLPPVTDYAAVGPFPAREFANNVGPGGAYTIFRPTNLNANGFKFIPATWGNGITTTPQFYPWLSTVASHGFVIIASNSSTVTAANMTAGLDWLIAQNDVAGDLQGKLDTNRAVCMGYSLGGGAAVTCAAHPKVITSIAMHPVLSLGTGLHGPLLLFSGTNDVICSPDGFVQPIYASTQVPTFYGLLDGADHLEPVITGGREVAPFIAWLRLWVFGDEAAKPFFYGADCKLCKAPWTKPQSKMLN